MSNLLHEIQRAVNEDIVPGIPKLSSEKSRKEMRANLLALEKMIKHIRQQLMRESKELTSARKQNRLAKKLNKNSPDNAQVDIQAHDDEE
jgi:hypothetical protein